MSKNNSYFDNSVPCCLKKDGISFNCKTSMLNLTIRNPYKKQKHERRVFMLFKKKTTLVNSVLAPVWKDGSCTGGSPPGN